MKKNVQFDNYEKVAQFNLSLVENMNRLADDIYVAGNQIN